MKNIITAIGDEDIYNILKGYKELNILYKDIQYEEGIIEAINLTKNAEIIIINNEIIVNKELEEIVQEIILKNKNIKIIILNFKELEYKNLEKIKNIKKIINKDENLINNLLNYLLEKNDVNIKYEIKTIESNIKNEKIKNNINLLELIKNKLKKEKQKNIITILGTQGAGKTIFSGILAKIYSENNYKVLLIDFDFEFKNLHILFHVKNYPKNIYKKLNNEEFLNEFKLKENNLNKLKVKINKKIKLISSADLFFDENYKINEENIDIFLNNLKQEFDVIIIDTNSEIINQSKSNIMKSVIKNSDKVVYLIENNLLQLKKTKKYLFEKIKEYDIEKNKINIICNKKESFQNNLDILKIIFKKIKIIGCINYNKEFNILINNNLKIEIPKKIKKEFQNIINKIEK